MQIYAAEKGNQWLSMHGFLICLMFYVSGTF